MPPPGGPVPQPWSAPKTAGESGGAPRDFTGAPPRPPQPGASEGPRPSDNRAAEPGSGGGEMDWDTALDTILKTLKKDRGVGEKT